MNYKHLIITIFILINSKASFAHNYLSINKKPKLNSTKDTINASSIHLKDTIKVNFAKDDTLIFEDDDEKFKIMNPNKNKSDSNSINIIKNETKIPLQILIKENNHLNLVLNNDNNIFYTIVIMNNFGNIEYQSAEVKHIDHIQTLKSGTYYIYTSYYEDFKHHQVFKKIIIF